MNPVGKGWFSLAVILYLFFDAVTIITQGEGGLIERLGRFDRQLAPGLHLKIPLIEKVSAKTSSRERVLDVPAQRCISADNAPLTADAIVLYRINDLLAWTLEIYSLQPRFLKAWNYNWLLKEEKELQF
mmetsp:Transcript_15613/g.20640  ORF Transcript_15613/g.20640 Transcript_15613/m.20640 type:complete len:129 (+) Transcript_15613:92-478(+)